MHEAGSVPLVTERKLFRIGTNSFQSRIKFCVKSLGSALAAIRIPAQCFRKVPLGR
jgi:hypothetical protein